MTIWGLGSYYPCGRSLLSFWLLVLTRLTNDIFGCLGREPMDTGLFSTCHSPYLLSKLKVKTIFKYRGIFLFPIDNLTNSLPHFSNPELTPYLCHLLPWWAPQADPGVSPTVSLCFAMFLQDFAQAFTMIYSIRLYLNLPMCLFLT